MTPDSGNAAGKPVASTQSMDMDELKRVREELRSSEERFRIIFEYAPDAYYLNDLEGRFIDGNKAAERLTGYKREEIIGKTFLESNLLPSDQVAKALELLATNARGEPTGPDELILNRKDGSQVVLGISTYPVELRGQSVVLAIARDITERKQAEEALRIEHDGLERRVERRTRELLKANKKLEREIEERKQAEEALRGSEEKYRELVENANSIILRFDTLGAITFFNEFAQSFFGYTEPEIIGKNMIGTIVPETDSSGRDLVAMIRDLVQHPERFKNNENENMCRNGERVWVSWTNKAITDGDGNVVGILAIGNDITERRRLEDQLRQALKMEAIGTLAGGVAHDFNNLLMAIQGNASLMLLETDPSHPSYERLKSIEQSVLSGSELTHQLLGFARGGKYEVKPTDLNELIQKTSSMFGRTRKEIRIHSKCQQDIWTTEVDAGQIEQVLLNLYVNAWHAMPGGGELYLETENVTVDEKFVKPYRVEPGDYVKISVTDTGIGMDAQTRQRIFEPFFTTKEMGRGTGLGLASVYGIVKNHGGFIDVYSERGHGTIFKIYLPASQRGAYREEEMSGDALRGTETILLVDDEEIVLEVSVQLLKSLGYKVMTVRSGTEALDMLREDPDNIDIVILDLIMPGMGGGETYDKMKGVDPNIRVLLSSGYSIDGQAKEILDRGCNGFIQKPFNMRELSHKIREILDTKKKGVASPIRFAPPNP